MSSDQTSSPTASEKQIVANAIVEGIRAGKLELPVIPKVASKVFSLTNDPNADMNDLSRLIHSDQAIASHVLRIANSASYTAGEHIVSLQQAVTRLGMKLLGEIAIAVAIQSDIFRAPEFEDRVKLLLKHALAAAAYGREVARKRRRNIEGQFLCGLLHSVGKPICLQLIATVQRQRHIKLSKEDVDQIVAALHAKIATKVAIDWKLPKQLQVTTVFFKKYTSAPSFKDESAATYLSQLLATWLLNPARFDPVELGQDPVFEFLNFYQDDVQDLFGRRDEVKSMVAAMEI